MLLAEMLSNQMNGYMIQVTMRMGAATDLAIFSGLLSPRRLGTSSPNTSER